MCVCVCVWEANYKDHVRCCSTTTTSWSAMFFEVLLKVLLPVHLNQMHCQTHVQSQGPYMYIPGPPRTVHSNTVGTTACELPVIPIGEI